MSKFLKVILVSAYAALLFQYLKSFLIVKNKDSIELDYVLQMPGSLKKILREIKQNGANLTIRKLTLDFKRPERLPTDFKYILKWSEAFSHYTTDFGNGQAVFLTNKCEYFNCFMTGQKNLLPDSRYFDAILFDVENDLSDHPILRAPHQYFIFTATESATDFPVCHSFYDNYYNLTWSYKLNSNIRWSFVTILDRYGKFVGPNINMNWIRHINVTSENVVRRLVHKKKAVAWFVSNCRSKSNREKIGLDLGKELSKYNLKLDVFGWCGHLTCPKDRLEMCLDMLEQDYYFYLSFESSLSEDYVTEKLMYPLTHFTVPIVYGGANYSRFLPPGSYINAGELKATEIAFKINEAIKKPEVYRNYFRWHNYYIYKMSPVIADVCSLCKMLNDPSLGHVSVKNFRHWWNPNYKQLCSESNVK